MSAAEEQKGDENLAQFVGSIARRTSDGGLAAATGAGMVAAVASLVWGGPGWMLPCALGLCVVAFGAWGISDRELGERVTDGRERGLTALRLARWLAASLGTLAGLAALFAALALTLGTWIS
ncbi:MAG TPA: hypothetical protein VFZ56_08110 [Gemmatimonadaceae bacterium]